MLMKYNSEYACGLISFDDGGFLRKSSETV